MLYDNTSIAVKEITGDGERKPTEEFSRLKSHYLFEAKFGRPAKGNDKGNVEGLVGYARRNFMVPVPRAASWEELNAQLAEQSRRELEHDGVEQQRHRGRPPAQRQAHRLRGQASVDLEHA